GAHSRSDKPIRSPVSNRATRRPLENRRRRTARRTTREFPNAAPRHVMPSREASSICHSANDCAPSQFSGLLAATLLGCEEILAQIAYNRSRSTVPREPMRKGPLQAMTRAALVYGLCCWMVLVAGCNRPSDTPQLAGGDTSSGRPQI